MADIEKTISIIFNGEDRVSQVVTSISGKLNQFDAVAGAIADPFAKVADGVLAADAALAALALGGLAYAYTKSVSFEAALIDLEKVIGDQPEALAAAKKAAFDLSSQYGTSSTEILASIANFKQAGFDVEEAMLLTKNSLDLMIAGELEANEASNLLVATLKGFNAPASEAGRLVDILNAVSNEYATNVEELARGMAGISPIASQMNFSFEETAALLVPVIEVFRSGDEAAVALKTGLLKLVDDAKPVREALASIGVTQTDANGKLRSGKDILFDVARAFQGLEENQKLFITSQLVGIEQSARMVCSEKFRPGLGARRKKFRSLNQEWR
ncbi:MAG: phage tail tape measure protein, partial [Desulfocurvibacter africanus]